MGVVVVGITLVVVVVRVTVLVKVVMGVAPPVRHAARSLTNALGQGKRPNHLTWKFTTRTAPRRTLLTPPTHPHTLSNFHDDPMKGGRHVQPRTCLVRVACRPSSLKSYLQRLTTCVAFREAGPKFHLTPKLPPL